MAATRGSRTIVAWVFPRQGGLAWPPPNPRRRCLGERNLTEVALRARACRQQAAGFAPTDDRRDPLPTTKLLANDWPLVFSSPTVTGNESPAMAFRARRYELRAHLGAGAMGTVHRAWDKELLAEVALKRLFARAGSEQLYLLKQEFRALRDLSHPNLA